MPLSENNYLQQLDQKQLDQLIVSIYENYGYDFSRYATQSLQRRVIRILQLYTIPTVNDLIEKLRIDEYFFYKFINEVTVGVTEMFRDPQAWKYFKETIVPQLAELPQIRIWHAGCSTGEEVYTMAILMKEAGLFDKMTQVATDINFSSIAMAQRGLYSYRKMELYQQNYKESGGIRSLASYYHLEDNNVHMHQSLLQNCRFRVHNLVSGDMEEEFDLVLCRNVLIYFDHLLQEDVVRLFHKSLTLGGYLMLGNYESLLWNNSLKSFSVLSSDFNIIKKIK